MKRRFVRATTVGMLVLFVPALVINAAAPDVALTDVDPQLGRLEPARNAERAPADR